MIPLFLDIKNQNIKDKLELFIKWNIICVPFYLIKSLKSNKMKKMTSRIHDLVMVKFVKIVVFFDIKISKKFK